MGIGEFIKFISYDKLNDVSKEVFKQKCDEATKFDINN